MKKVTSNQESSRFPFRFSKTLITLSIAAICLCTLGIAISIYRMIKYGVDGFYDVIRYPFLIVICALAIVLVVALLIKSEYVISEKYLHANFGLIKSKTELKKITSISIDFEEEKISVYTGEQFFVMLLKKDEAQKFSHAIIQANPDVQLSFSLTDSKPQDESSNE